MMTLVVITVLAALLPACGGKEEAPITVPEGAQAGDLVGLEPCTYEAKDVEYAADCGTLVVPENWDNPNSRLIALPVIRLRATGSNPTEPIFRFAGGPGETNMHFSIPEGLIENHDIVMVGYRGVDGSVVLDCPEVNPAWKDTGGNLYSDEAIANLRDAFARCAARLQGEGVDLDGYTMLEVIEDNEAARKGLGYERVNLFGASYGTRLAMFYEWMYPERLHRVIMAAVNPPGHLVWQPEIIGEQIKYDASLCAQDPECSARTDDLAETMRNVTHNMPSRWLFLPIDPGKVKFLTLFLLFHRGSAATAYNAYLAAEEGDPSGLALLSLMYDFMWPSMEVWGEWASKGSPDMDRSRDWATEMDPPGSILTSPSIAFAFAKDWPEIPIPAEFLQVQPSDVETLLVNGNIDYSTPQQFIEEILPALSNGQQVILSEFGHTGDFRKYQPEARIHMLTTFYDTGEVDDSLYTYQPMDFAVDTLMNDYPKFAKLIVAVIVLVIVLLVALVWFIVRKVRRRRAA
jgi:pimeloyl-ACP methyl ester carboxylesterase